MSEQQSIRDELIQVLDESDPDGGCYDLEDREGFWGPQADAILASSAIRRIQAKAIRDAAEAYWHDFSLTRYGEVRDWFENCADRVKNGATA